MYVSGSADPYTDEVYPSYLDALEVWNEYKEDWKRLIHVVIRCSPCKCSA